MVENVLSEQQSQHWLQAAVKQWVSDVSEVSWMDSAFPVTKYDEHSEPTGRDEIVAEQHSQRGLKIPIRPNRPTSQPLYNQNFLQSICTCLRKLQTITEFKQESLQGIIQWGVKQIKQVLI